jgi:hypothetical protein
MTSPLTINSTVSIGKIGGAIGGILVKNHEIAGHRIVINKTYRQPRNILPTITGMNMGKNAGPSPNR